jgi:Chromo (CHRromatin Organisation MOdifier) domain
MGFEPHQLPSHLESVNEFKEQMEESLSKDRAALTKAKDDMLTYYNRWREPAPIFAPGDKVYLDASDIHTTRPSQKLAHWRLGPYAVERQVGLQAYCLHLPKSLSRLHPVFPGIKLTPAPNDPIPGRQPVPPPPPVLCEGEEHFEVEKVLDSRMRANCLQLLIKWKGYGYEENSWENERDVQASDLIAEFYCLHPGAPRRIFSLEVATFRNWVPVPPVGLHASGRRILDGG